MKMTRVVPGTRILLLCGFLAATPPNGHAQDAEPAQAAAIAKIHDAGGRVEHEDMKPDGPVVDVSFATKPVGDDVLQALAGFPQIRKLTLNNTKVTDDGLKGLAGLESLEKLYLVDTSITDAGLVHLKALPGLKILSLVGTQITDSGLEALREIKSLETLFLAGTKATDEGVAKLKEACPELEVVR